jgi:hypothetical protein
MTRFGYCYGTDEICNVYIENNGKQYRAIKHSGNLWNGCILEKGNWKYIPGRIDQDSWINSLRGYI